MHNKHDIAEPKVCNVPLSHDVGVGATCDNFQSTVTAQILPPDVNPPQDCYNIVGVMTVLLGKQVIIQF